MAANNTHLESELSSHGSYQDMLDSYKEHYTHYEADFAAGNYDAPRLVCEAVNRMYPKDGSVPRDELKVMDIAAGTGLVGQQLYDEGVRHLDAIDPSQEMMGVAMKRGIYGKYIEDTIGEHETQVKADTYDAVVVAGGFVQGHLPPEALDEMIRICKPGGYIINSMRFEYLVTVPEYHRLERHMDDLEEAGKWRRVDRRVTDRYFFDTKQGITYIYQKL
ncbi:uncharacterized protein LOC119110477 isoform X2 [Pollicipes pollicipes]|uniref:uncharacterized protein LOC119110477 isoform X2 n=2 Tax=Pollicipes pollicipes TaxID=41117 RepID=UPI00188559A5|nr:uncharacterized protein LOC119110477 isoform X2 [Pollicipes pollicipes]